MDPDIRQEFKGNDLHVVALVEVIPNESNIIHSLDPDFHQEVRVKVTLVSRGGEMLQSAVDERRESYCC